MVHRRFVIACSFLVVPVLFAQSAPDSAKTPPQISTNTDGTGTANKIPMWSDLDTLTDSVMTQSGTSIGVGTATPSEKLEVVAGSLSVNAEDSGLLVDAAGYKRFAIFKESGLNPELRYSSSISLKIRRVTSGSIKSSASSDVPMTFSSLGNIGIGTTAPLSTSKLDVWGEMRVRAGAPGTEAVGKLILTNSTTASGDPTGPTSPVAQWIHFIGTPNSLLGITPNGYEITEYPINSQVVGGATAFGLKRIVIQPANRTNPGALVIDGAGNLIVGGNVTASGSITGASVLGAVYQDVAEWVPATTDMAPGTVVVLNPQRSNEVMPSDGEYDTRVAGVVSAQPGILLGVASESKEQIATTGRVKVKVDATRAPIAIGDLLVTSATPGVAMKSQPMEIGGRQFHQPGTIIGKALEALPSGTGEILVLLSLQ